MIPAELIKRKRNGGTLTPSEIKEFINGYMGGTVADYQMSAWLMAVFFEGMNETETWALTEAMLHSGIVADLSDVKGPKIDKHSTGGVGDKTSLVIGPMAAAAGVKVPMISGRGLGHTGGTLDKLESIPGFNTQLSLERFKEQVARAGICFIGQTKEICPSDKRMYALRDVTATVECIPLICASIMSKKLAEGIDGLVLDIKVGTGAFMKSLKDAENLAKNLIKIAVAGKKRVAALITDMDQPLGQAVGNALEVTECLEVMSGRGPADLRKLCIELAAHMILLGKKAKDISGARKLAVKILDDGSALKCFEEVVRLQGGDLSRLPRAQHITPVPSRKSGTVKALDAESMGLASLSLGAGRLKAEDVIDPTAGLIIHKKIGDKVKKGEALVSLYHNRIGIEEAEALIHQAYEIGSGRAKTRPLIARVMLTKGKK